MKFKNLNYFFTLAETLNFTHAAKKCNITQTAMSRYLSNLEKELDVKLFQRDSHKVTLTRAGEIYYKEMKHFLSEYSSLEKKLKAASAQYEGWLRIGIGLYEYCRTEQLFADFFKAYPKIKTEIYQYPYNELTKRLRTSDLDLIIGLNYCKKVFRDKDIVSKEIFHEENILLMNSNIASSEEGHTASEIMKNQYLITNCEDEGPCSLEMLHDMLLENAGFIPAHLIQTNSLPAQILMVKSGHGVAIVPRFLDEIHQNDLRIMEMPGENMQYYDMIRLKKNENRAAELFMSFIAQ